MRYPALRKARVSGCRAVATCRQAHPAVQTTQARAFRAPPSIAGMTAPWSVASMRWRIAAAAEAGLEPYSP